MKKVKKFLNYAVSHQYLIVTYHPSEMILICNSDATYLREQKVRIRAGGIFDYLVMTKYQGTMDQY